MLDWSRESKRAHGEAEVMGWAGAGESSEVTGSGKISPGRLRLT